ncbi:MAG: methionyl-tRNA formyltransferase, partial [Oleibacter sp.]|nr:methionyl-tRNA formyltransferase [Thalassolituus sp.]
MTLRIIFAGTPEFAAVHLDALLASDHQVIAVYTQPDRPAGRGKKLQPSPVKQKALEHGIDVFQPINFKDSADVDQLASLNADVMVVVAYGLLLPLSVLQAPKQGCLNVHGSLLPRWRGAAPIQRCIEAGDKLTGITIMQMDVGLDTGNMLHKVSMGVAWDETGGSLYDRLAEMGPPALLKTLDDLANNQLKPEQQNDALSCYAHKLTKQEALIDWTQDSELLERRVRAFYPFPVAYTLLGDERIRVLAAEVVDLPTSLAPGTIVKVSAEGIDVACGEQQLRLIRLQLAGKKPMHVSDIINGQPNLFQPF